MSAAKPLAFGERIRRDRKWLTCASLPVLRDGVWLFRWRDGQCYTQPELVAHFGHREPVLPVLPTFTIVPPGAGLVGSGPEPPCPPYEPTLPERDAELSRWARLRQGRRP